MSTVDTPLQPHLDRPDWLKTPKGDPRGYIDPEGLTELWFHTGTTCNLRCPFCLEGSHPGDMRIQPILFDDARPFLDEAVELGVEDFGFTGGEPFLIDDFVRILDYALQSRPCLVLTNGTEPLLNRLGEVRRLADHPHPLKLRISLDYPDAALHDRGRGPGNFRKALEACGRLHRYGFDVSIARQWTQDEDTPAVEQAYRELLRSVGIEEKINLVSFPDFLTPGSEADVPYITENCMREFQTAESRAQMMCNFSKMVVKKGGRMRVYACTLVDDDPDYDLGGTLRESLRHRVMLKHHRCYSCFAFGASCSER